MTDDKKEVALRKRQQIDSSKKTMFMFVAGSAFVVGISLVVSYFLVQQIIFHTRIISQKANTIATLEKNVETIGELKDNLRVLETNKALESVKFKSDNSNLQTVLDALPAEANADALGASLQDKFAGGVNGLTVENIIINTEDMEYGDEFGNGGDSASMSGEFEGEDGISSIDFTMSVSGTPDQLKELLARLERSIRVVDVYSIEVNSSDTGLTMNIIGGARYELAQKVELEKEVIKP